MRAVALLIASHLVLAGEASAPLAAPRATTRTHLESRTRMGFQVKTARRARFLQEIADAVRDQGQGRAIFGDYNAATEPRGQALTATAAAHRTLPFPAADGRGRVFS